MQAACNTFQTYSKEWQSFVRFNVSLIFSHAKTLEDDNCKNKNFGYKILIFGPQNKNMYTTCLQSYSLIIRTLIC